MKKARNIKRYRRLLLKKKVWILFAVLFLGAIAFLMGSTLLSAKASAGPILPDVLAEADTWYVLYLCSGYRTLEAQASLFSKSIREKGIAHACSRNALEGRSEHNLGLALDISTTDAGVISSGFAGTAAGTWVGEYCHEYGFILRYPEDKTSITGYVFEPWHYRYVGVDLAGTLYTSGQTLEEYYGKVPAAPADS